MLGRTARAAMAEEVDEWLGKLKLRSLYLQNFIDQGFDTLDSIATLTEADLDALGVQPPGHRARILKHLPASTPPPSPPAAANVEVSAAWLCLCRADSLLLFLVP